MINKLEDFVIEMVDDDDFDDDEDDYLDDEDDDDYIEPDTVQEIEVRKEFSLEDDRVRARNALLAATDRTMATFIVSSPNKIVVNIDAACHAGFNGLLKNDIVMVASCFETRETEKATRCMADSGEDIKEVSEKYWDFMTGDRSPWKTLFQVARPEGIRDNYDRLVGFFLEPQLASTYPTHALNYCIGMRMIGEERETLRMWDRLVQNGVYPADALYLARMLHHGDKEDPLVIFSGNHNNTSHWPISHSRWSADGDYRSFSFHRFRNGDPKFEGNGNDEIAYWCTEPKYPDFSFEKIKPVKKGNYNDWFNLQDVIDAFYDWQKKHDQFLGEEERKVA